MEDRGHWIYVKNCTSDEYLEGLKYFLAEADT